MGERITGINWEDVAKSQLIPDGNYAVRIDKVEARTSEKGNAYWNIEYTVQEPEQLLGRKLWDVFMLDVASLWKIRSLCSALGIELKGARDFDSDELLQQEVGVVVSTDTTRQGEERNRIKKYFTLSVASEPETPAGAPA